MVLVMWPVVGQQPPLLTFIIPVGFHKAMPPAHHKQLWHDFHLAFSQCILTQTFFFLSFSVQIASRRPANEITFPHYRNLPFSFSCSLSCSQIQYWSFCSLGKRKMWTTAAAATSALTLLIPLALPPADRPTESPTLCYQDKHGN